MGDLITYCFGHYKFAVLAKPAKAIQISLQLLGLAVSLIIVACQKPDDPLQPCTEVTVDKSTLDIQWSTSSTSAPSSPSTFPIIWKDKVLVADGSFPQHILCYDGASGSLIWEVAIDGFILDNELKRSGDKLYWTDDHVLWSLDLNTATAEKVCAFSQGSLSRHFAIWNDVAFCSLYECTPPCDTVTGVAYKIDIQAGTYQEVYRSAQLRPNQELAVILDPSISVNTDGDTLFCFIESSRLMLQSVEYESRFVCRNLTQGTTTFSAALQHLFGYREGGNLMLHEGKAYVPIGDTVCCFSTEKGAILWKQNVKRGRLAIAQGMLLCSPDGYYIASLDLNDGHTIWQSSFIGYNIETFQSAFAKNDQFYFIGEYAFCSLDLTSGCLLSQQHAPAVTLNGGNLSNGFALSDDGKLIYLLHYPSLIAATFSR